MNDPVGIGDVLVVRGSNRVADIIRLGAILRRRPALHNHVAIAHHWDEAGTLWCVEGRPGGVGWVSAAQWLADPYTVTNAAQPKTDDQRELIARVVESAIGTPYDYVGIGQQATLALGIPALWAQDFDGQGPPAHVICSALGDWATEEAGLASPGGNDGTRHTDPALWTAFCIERLWERT